MASGDFLTNHWGTFGDSFYFWGSDGWLWATDGIEAHRVSPLTNTCPIDVFPEGQSFGPAGGGGGIRLEGDSACTWSASTSAPWITITSAVQGQGSARVGFTVAANDTNQDRADAIQVGGQTVPITQAAGSGGPPPPPPPPGCTYGVFGEGQSFTPSGGPGSVRVETTPECGWQATADAPWIQLDVASGQGNGWVRFTVLANSSSSDRAGQVVIAGQPIAISQAAGSGGPGPGPCTHEVMPEGQSYGPGGGQGSARVDTTPECGWTATSPVPWITMDAGQSATGSGTARFTVAANQTSLDRSATLTIAGQAMPVSQAAFQVTTTAAAFGGLGGTGSIRVQTTDRAPWRAWSNSSHVSFDGEVAQEGPGSLRFRVAPHMAGAHVDEVVVAHHRLRIGHDAGSTTYTLAEGATGPFFTFDLALANPTMRQAAVVVRFVGEDGRVLEQPVALAPLSRQTIRVNDVPGFGTGPLSTMVESPDGVPVVVERSMFWDAAGYGGHAEAAVLGAATQWYFAEGAQGFFDTYLLLANPGLESNDVVVRFMPETGSVVHRRYQVAPRARVTVATSAIPELASSAFSMVVESAKPIVAERAMYFGGPRFWEGGHVSAGTTAPATQWFHAEGATGAWFDAFLLLANPQDTLVTATVRYLLESGETIERSYVLGRTSRRTIDIEREDDRLRAASFSMAVTATRPIVSERSMYWAGPAATWTEAHNSFGTTDTGLRLAFAEGRVGGPSGFETFLLVANPDEARTAVVRVTFLRSSGTPVVREYGIAASSRFSLHVNSAVPELDGESFGMVIESLNGVGLAAERALYWDAGGVTWAGGSNVVATRIP